MISNLYKTDKRLVWVAICGSLLLSIWAVHMDDIVNNDGIEYIKSAAAILQGDWASALHTYKWPFYSAMIAFTSFISGLSLTASTHIINAVFNAWLVLGFVALVRLLGGKRNTLWFAVLLILAFPIINKFRPYLIRDPAFLALFLSACYAFFLYIKDGLKRHNVVAIACFLAAALFRLEGLVYLLLTQAFLFNQHFAQRGGGLLRLAGLLFLLILLLVFITWWQFTSTDELGYSSIITQPGLFFQAAWGQIAEAFSHRLGAIAGQSPIEYSNTYAVLKLFGSAVSTVFLALLHSLYYLYFILWLLAWRRGVLFPQAELFAPWRFLILASLPVLIGFVMVQGFITNRYLIAIALLMLLATPFLLASWHDALKAQGHNKIAFWLVIVLVILTGLKGLDLGTKKHYLRTAAEWMAETLPVGARVYTNNRILGHYYGREIWVGKYWSTKDPFAVDAFLARRKMQYGAFTIKPDDLRILARTTKMLNRKVLAVFENEQGAQVVVFDFNRKPDSAPPRAILVE